MLFELLDNLKKSEYEVKAFPYYSPARRGAAAALIHTAIHILEDEAVTHHEIANVRNRIIDYMKEHPAVSEMDVGNAIEDTKVLIADPIMDFHQEREKAILEDGEEYMTEEEMDAILEETEIEGYTLAEEIKDKNPRLLAYIEAKLPGKEHEFIAHTELKKRSAECKFAIRTGKFTPYPNVILRAGCAF